MFLFIKTWWAAYRRPSDPLFKRRPKAKLGFGKWLLVEVGATDYVILMDTLHNIHRTDADIERKGRELMGLRYQALAMSLRTKRGKIPLDWRSPTDLMWLASLPYSEVSVALEQISELSDIPWLNPLQQNQDPPATDQDVPHVAEEGISANP
jgi:hypothetical protein